MNKTQKTIAIFFIVTAIIIASLVIFYFYKQNSLDNSKELILYYSLTCPHCKIVEDFINENDINSKLNITQKEVSQNLVNANALVNAGTKCKIAKEYIGAVPLLFYKGACYVGDKEIINLLKKESGVN